jgi:hypothetical protein
MAAAAVSTLNSVASAVGVAASTVAPSNWYRADALLGLDANGNPNALPADGTFFSKWIDLSGNGKDTSQITSTRRPTFRASAAGSSNTLPAVRFNLNSDVGGTAGTTSTEYLYFPGLLANTATSKLNAFIVANDSGTRSGGTASRGTLLNTRTGASTSTNNGFILGSNNTKTAVYGHVGHTTENGTGPANQTAAATDGSGFTLTQLSRDALTTTLSRYTNLGVGTTTTTWGGTRTLNGLTYTGFTPSTQSLGGTPITQIGTEAGGNYFYGDIAEIVIYDETALGARDQKIITNYLGEKYGIASADLPDQPGDTNADYQVNFTDLVTLAQHYNLNSGQSRSTGDLDGDGVVGFADLVLLAQNYNVGVGSIAMPADASAQFASDFALAQSLVPEPTAAGLIVAGSVALARRRRRA